jgi:hypothetical protein
MRGGVVRRTLDPLDSGCDLLLYWAWKLNVLDAWATAGGCGADNPACRGRLIRKVLLISSLYEQRCRREYWCRYYSCK